MYKRIVARKVFLVLFDIICVFKFISPSLAERSHKVNDVEVLHAECAFVAATRSKDHRSATHIALNPPILSSPVRAPNY